MSFNCICCRLEQSYAICGYDADLYFSFFPQITPLGVFPYRFLIVSENEPEPNSAHSVARLTTIAPILFGMGFGGVYFLYKSTKYAYKPRQAYMTAVIGASLLSLAYIFLEYIIIIKTS